MSTDHDWVYRGGLDVSSTSNLVNIKPKRKGSVSIATSFVIVDSATASGVVQLLVDTVEVATATLTGKVKGDQVYFTPVTAYENAQFESFTATSEIQLKTKTAGAGTISCYPSLALPTDD